MCFKAGNDELDTVKNLMLMALRAAIAQALDVEMDELEPEQRLVEDLAMDAAGRAELVELIADTFDGLTLDLDALETIGQIYEAVVLEEFRDLEAQAAAAGEQATAAGELAA
jgi:acyl carrier protein